MKVFICYKMPPEVQIRAKNNLLTAGISTWALYTYHAFFFPGCVTKKNLYTCVNNQILSAFITNVSTPAVLSHFSLKRPWDLLRFSPCLLWLLNVQYKLSGNKDERDAYEWWHYKLMLFIYSVRCEQKTIKHAYHTVCSRCAQQEKVCEKCGKPQEIVAK